MGTAVTVMGKYGDVGTAITVMSKRGGRKGFAVGETGGGPGDMGGLLDGEQLLH